MQLTTNVSITGGTLTTAGTGIVHVVVGQTGSLTNLTNQGTFIADDNSTTQLSGTISNSGSMKIKSTGNLTRNSR